MKRIIVGSVGNARGYKPAPRERYAIISFVEVGASAPAIKRHVGCVGRLIIYADDVQTADEGQYVPLSPRDAAKIAAFCVKWYGKVDTLLIHCRMGLSRSPAAAQAIANILGIHNVEYMSQDVIANRLVRELVESEMQRLLSGQMK